MNTPDSPPVRPEDIAAVRRFNRFHTQWVGALDEHLLATDYALPQVRVLYEIAQAMGSSSKLPKCAVKTMWGRPASEAMFRKRSTPSISMRPCRGSSAR